MHIGLETMYADSENYVIYCLRTLAFWHCVPGTGGTEGFVNLFTDRPFETVQKYFVCVWIYVFVCVCRYTCLYTCLYVCVGSVFMLGCCCR